MAYFVEEVFEHVGLTCVIIMQDAGHRCGYVGVPKDHPLYKTDYFDIDEKYDVHGGLTYSSSRPGEKYPLKTKEKLWWFGFDCAHYDDYPDFNAAIKEIPESNETLMDVMDIYNHYPRSGTIRTKEFVEEECKKLAEELQEG